MWHHDVTNGLTCQSFCRLFDRLPVRISTSDFTIGFYEKNSIISELMILECSFPLKTPTCSTHSQHGVRDHETCENLRKRFTIGLVIIILDLLQTDFRYDFRKGPRDISAGTVFTVFTVFICILAFNYRKYRKFRTGRNLTRTFPKIVPKFVLQKVYIMLNNLHIDPHSKPTRSSMAFVHHKDCLKESLLKNNDCLRSLYWPCR